MRPPAGTGEVDRLFGELLRMGDEPRLAAFARSLGRPGTLVGAAKGLSKLPCCAKMRSIMLMDVGFL